MQDAIFVESQMFESKGLIHFLFFGVPCEYLGVYGLPCISKVFREMVETSTIVTCNSILNMRDFPGFWSKLWLLSVGLKSTGYPCGFWHDFCCTLR